MREPPKQLHPSAWEMVIALTREEAAKTRVEAMRGGSRFLLHDQLDEIGDVLENLAPMLACQGVQKGAALLRLFNLLPPFGNAESDARLLYATLVLLRLTSMHGFPASWSKDVWEHMDDEAERVLPVIEAVLRRAGIEAPE